MNFFDKERFQLKGFTLFNLQHFTLLSLGQSYCKHYLIFIQNSPDVLCGL
jgi:hypothetical protein